MKKVVLQCACYIVQYLKIRNFLCSQSHIYWCTKIFNDATFHDMYLICPTQWRDLNFLLENHGSVC